MTIWISELFTPGELIHNLAVLLVIVALAMPTLTLVRVVALIGGVVGMAVTGLLSVDRVGFVWWALLTAVVLLRLVWKDPRGLFGRLSKEDSEFHRNVVPGLNKRRVAMLLRIGAWKKAEAGLELTRQGEPVANLIYVSRGRIAIMVDGRQVGEVADGSLVGEVGVSTGEAATATAVAVTPIRFLAFPTARLYPFLDDHPVIQDAVELAVDRNLREKLARANMAAAHPGAAG